MVSFTYFALLSNFSVVALVRVRRALPHSSHLGLVDQAHVAPVGVFLILEQTNEQLDVGDKLLKLRGMLHKTARDELTNNDFMAKNQCFQRPSLFTVWKS